MATKRASGPLHDDGGADQDTNDTVAADDEKPGQAGEVGGRDGPDPTRFGDWEKDGRCIDF